MCQKIDFSFWCHLRCIYCLMPKVKGRGDNIVMNVKSHIYNLMRKTEFGEKILTIRQKKKDKTKIFNELLSDIGACEKVIIFGTDDLSYLLGEALGNRCVFYIDFSLGEKQTLNGKPIKKYDELILLENLEDYKIVPIPCRTVVKKIDLLFDMGISWNQIILNESWRLYLGGKSFDLFDNMVGFSRQEDLPGFTIFEDREKIDEKYTIVTLGGSTTDPYCANVISWSEFLFYQLKDMGINARVVCGGLSSYHSGQEFIKLFRDVLPMEPDMVISYSGVNDTKYFKRRHVCENYPYVMMHQSDFLDYSMKLAVKKGYFHGTAFHDKVNNWTLGVPDYEDPSHIWVRNERMMHAICEEFGIRFYAFLQPNRDYGGYIKTGEPEKSSYARNLNQNMAEVREWYAETRSLIKGKDYIIDLSELFAGQKNIYFDNCHVFERGNKKIETAIFKHIIKAIRSDVQVK